MNPFRRRIGFCILAGVILSASSLSVAAAQEMPPKPLIPTEVKDARTPTSISAISDAELLEKLEKPIVPEDVAAWTDAVQRQFDGHPQFQGVEIDDTRTKVTVWWHDAPTAELETALATPLSASVEVKSTAFSPAELEAAVDRVFSDESLAVSYAAIRPDGSGIDITTARQSRGGSADTDVEKIAGVPVSSTSGSVQPYTNRQFDTYLIGGGRYAGWYNNAYAGACTSGFSIVKKNDATVRGFVTAAHCGSVGSQWGPQQNNTIYTTGTMQERHTAIDAAVVQSSPGLPYQAYVYTGAYNSGTVTAINGNRSAPINAEICYTGSYTGLVCGNFITSKSATWNLGGDLSNVTGMRTQRSNNAGIAAGQGDSGGPGYWLTLENGVVKRYAAAIISAGPDAQQGGCPGLVADRLCGPTVVAGETWQFTNSTAWDIAYIP